MADLITSAQRVYDDLMTKADPRVEDWFMMSSPVPSFIICILYIVIVILGPTIMGNKKPMNIKNLLVVYNLCMVALSAYCFVEFLMAGWLNGYSLHCQPVDYSRRPDAMRMASVCWVFYISKIHRTFRYNSPVFGLGPSLVPNKNWTRNIFCVTAIIAILKALLLLLLHRRNLTKLHFCMFSIMEFMPVSWWFGVKFVAGGFGTFHSLLNSFIHFVMYTYYLLAALGPQYQKYLWWKKYMTKMQIIQFVLCLIHSSQLLFMECNYPMLFAYWIGLYSVIFLVMFANFYRQAYFASKQKQNQNGVVQNGKHKSQ